MSGVQRTTDGLPLATMQSDGPKSVGILFCVECNNMLYPKEDKGLFSIFNVFLKYLKFLNEFNRIVSGHEEYIFSIRFFGIVLNKLFLKKGCSWFSNQTILN